MVALVACAPSVATGQSELAVEPGLGTLNDAIENDTDRPDDRVYVLERGGVYPLDGILTNDGFTLRIKAADGEGVRPVIYPGSGLESRFITLLGDTYLTGVYLLGVAESGDQKGIPVAVSGDGMRLVIEDCVFEGGSSRYFEVNGADTRITIRDSHIRNLVRPDNVSNGRAIDYRGVAADSLFIQNTSFLNVTGYVIRYDGPALEHFIFDRNTVHTTSNDLTTSSLGNLTVEYVVTNNLFVNVNGPGVSPSDDPDGILNVNFFSGSGFTEADRSIRIANNGVATSQAILDYYEARAGLGDPIIPLQLIHPSSQDFLDGSSQATTEGNVSFDDPIDFQSLPRLDSYVAFLGAARDGAAEPPFWAFGTDDDLFPAEQPLPEDLAYPEAEPAHMASEGRYPLGDLNWFPDLKALWESGVGVATASGPDGGDSFVLRGTSPNPSAGALTVRLDLDTPGTVSVGVFDLLGRAVLSTPSTAMDAGTMQAISLDASALPTGVYLYRVTVESGGQTRSQTGRLTLAR